LDSVELLNYELIERLSPDLSEMMPVCYGKIQIGGKEYIVMENSRLSRQGHPIKQRGDFKFTGKLEETDTTFNPIVEPLEIWTTRNKERGRFHRWVTDDGIERSPSVQVAQGPRLLRNFYYSKSGQFLRDVFSTLTPEQCTSLIRQLNGLIKILEEGPVALIGSSLMLTEDRDRTVRLLLIDPAHVQFDATALQAAKDKVPCNGKDQKFWASLPMDSVFTSATEGSYEIGYAFTRYTQYKESNQDALKYLRDFLIEIQRKNIHEEEGWLGDEESEVLLDFEEI